LGEPGGEAEPPGRQPVGREEASSDDFGAEVFAPVGQTEKRAGGFAEVVPAGCELVHLVRAGGVRTVKVRSSSSGTSWKRKVFAAVAVGLIAVVRVVLAGGTWSCFAESSPRTATRPQGRAELEEDRRSRW